MKPIRNATLVLILTIFSFSIAHAQTPCIDGMVAGYPCENVDLWSFISLDDMGGGNLANDIWGWVDPNSNREFALAGKNNATAFVEITDPANPVYLGHLPTHTVNSTWRDIKVYQDYAFIVSEAGGHGMQVFDLSQLLTVTSPQVFTESAHYDGFGGSHNVAINEETGFAYSVGDNTFSGGLHVVDINDPLNPIIAGGYEDDGYIHDCQAVVYHGPDLDYTDKEIVFTASQDHFAIMDVEDKTDIELISGTYYAESAYTHQCWATEDHRFLIFGDELDETNGYTTFTRTYIYNIEDLDNPFLVTIFEGPTTAIDHNLYTQGNLIFMSNYKAGLRIVDAGGVESGNLIERAYFDVIPNSDSPQFDGTWSNYPYFPSGNVIVSSFGAGFFIVRPQLFQFSEDAASVDCNTNSATFELTIPTDLLSSTFSLGVEGLPGSPIITSSEITIPGTTNITISNLSDLPVGTTFFKIILNGDYEHYVIPAALEVTELEVSIKTYLQGSYNNESAIQEDFLRQDGQIPLTEPYTTLGFNHINGGNETTTQAIMDVSDENAIVDWIFVELRSSIDSSIIIATQSALLQIDGDIVAMDGVSPLKFSCINEDEVYIVLRHRNHLGVRSLNSFSTSTTISFDFTDPSQPLLGIDKMIEINGIRIMIAGDANNDGQINPVDKNDFWRLENGLPYNYYNTKADFDMNGAVNPVDKNDYWRINNSSAEELE